MTDDKLRRRIAVEAASLLLRRQETHLPRARMRAARRLCRGYVPRNQFPSEAEIRDEIEKRSYIGEGDARFDNVREQRLTALHLMRSLAPYEPRLTGSLASGQIRSSGTIEILIDPKYEPDVRRVLEEFDGEDSDADETNDAGRDTAIHIEFVPDAEQSGLRLGDFEHLLLHDYPDLDLNSDEELLGPSSLDRFPVYRMLLAPLAQVEQRKSTHPEGDALYHSLQVFQLALEELPYDEEFLLAALLHDVGKGIDSVEPVQAALNALRGHITERTAWFIENLPEAAKIFEGTIGSRARRRIQQHPDGEELLLLAKCDREGRVSGGKAPELDAALETIRELARICG